MKFWVGFALSRLGWWLDGIGCSIGGRQAIRRYNLKRRAAKRAKEMQDTRLNEAMLSLVSMSDEDFEAFLRG